MKRDHYVLTLFERLIKLSNDWRDFVSATLAIKMRLSKQLKVQIHCKYTIRGYLI